VRLFEGLPRFDEALRLGDEVVANLPRYEELADNWLLDNLNAVQRQNGLPLSSGDDLCQRLLDARAWHKMPVSDTAARAWPKPP